MAIFKPLQDGEVTVAKLANEAKPIGTNQTWQAVSRTSGVTYTNTTGRPIMLVRSSVSSASANTGASISIDGGTAFIFSRAGSAYGPASAAGAVIIPNGSTYVVTDILPGTISTFELR